MIFVNFGILEFVWFFCPWTNIQFDWFLWKSTEQTRPCLQIGGCLLPFLSPVYDNNEYQNEKFWFFFILLWPSLNKSMSCNIKFEYFTAQSRRPCLQIRGGPAVSFNILKTHKKILEILKKHLVVDINININKKLAISLESRPPLAPFQESHSWIGYITAHRQSKRPYLQIRGCLSFLSAAC